MTLRETLAIKSFEDVHLVHDEVDNEPATITELHSGTLTEAGKKDWADVLDAEVLSVFEGIYGLQIQLSGAKSRRLDEFSIMLAGHCTMSDYDKWVAPDTEDKQTFYLPVTWEVCGFVEVEADTIEAAVDYFNINTDNIELPDDSTYVDSSFELSSDDIECLRVMSEGERERRKIKK